MERCTEARSVWAAMLKSILTAMAKEGKIFFALVATVLQAKERSDWPSQKQTGKLNWSNKTLHAQIKVQKWPADIS